MKFQKICVLGLGYIGLPTASTFATNGVQVVGIDVNPHVIETLRNGGIHIQEPGLDTLVRAAIQSGKLTIHQQPEPADAFIIAVPTPFYADKRADLSYVVAAAESLLPHLRPGNLVVLESTSPPRTTADIVAPILKRSGLGVGVGLDGGIDNAVYLAYSPERVLPGQILRELIENARVIGGVDRPSAEAGRDLYATFVRGEIVLTDATTAEMVKLMENTYRDVNIAIANEFASLAERFGIDGWEAIAIANRHPRVKILNPGPGVGGHCISVDPWFLVEAAPDLTPLIQISRRVNDGQPHLVVERIHSELGELRGKRIAVLGLAYKPDVDDLRESPAIEVSQLLAEAGASVTAYEPFKVDAQVAGVSMAPTLESAIGDAEMLVLLVAHSQFKTLEPQQVASITPARLVFDAVNVWPTRTWNPVGFQLMRLGDGSPKFQAR